MQIRQIQESPSLTQGPIENVTGMQGATDTDVQEIFMLCDSNLA